MFCPTIVWQKKCELALSPVLGFQGSSASIPSDTARMWTAKWWKSSDSGASKSENPKRYLGWNPDVEANNLETLMVVSGCQKHIQGFGIFQTFLGEPMRTTPCQVAYKVVSSMCARCISVCAQLQRSTRKQARCNCSSSYNFISGARGQVVSWTGWYNSVRPWSVSSANLYQQQQEHLQS